MAQINVEQTLSDLACAVCNLHADSAPSEECAKALERIRKLEKAAHKKAAKKGTSDE